MFHTYCNRLTELAFGRRQRTENSPVNVVILLFIHIQFDVFDSKQLGLRCSRPVIKRFDPRLFAADLTTCQSGRSPWRSRARHHQAATNSERNQTPAHRQQSVFIINADESVDSRNQINILLDEIIQQLLSCFQVYKLLRLNFRGLSWRSEMVFVVRFTIFESSVFRGHQEVDSSDNATIVRSLRQKITTLLVAGGGVLTVISPKTVLLDGVKQSDGTVSYCTLSASGVTPHNMSINHITAANRYVFNHMMVV